MRRLTLTLLFAAACAGDSSNSPTDSGGPTCVGDLSVVVGSGVDQYVPLAANDPVTMVHGPQGGWHVDTAGLVGGASQNVSVMPVITVPSLGVQIAGDQQPQFIALAGYDEAACSGQFSGARAFIDDVAASELPAGMDYQQFVCSLEGETLELSVTVDDIEAGSSTTQTVQVTAALDPVDVAPCAQ